MMQMKQFRKVASRLRSIKASKSISLDSSFDILDRTVRSFSVKCSQFCKTRFSRDVFDRLANDADELSQAILQTDNLASLTTTKIAGLAGGSLSTSLGCGVASLFGTAGTGPAISSLSGAEA